MAILFLRRLLHLTHKVAYYPVVLDANGEKKVFFMNSLSSCGCQCHLKNDYHDHLYSWTNSSISSTSDCLPPWSVHEDAAPLRVLSKAFTLRSEIMGVRRVWTVIADFIRVGKKGKLNFKTHTSGSTDVMLLVNTHSVTFLPASDPQTTCTVTTWQKLAQRDGIYLAA